MKFNRLPCLFMLIGTLISAKAFTQQGNGANAPAAKGKNAAGPETEGYTLSAFTAKQGYLPDEKIVLSVVLKNVGKEKVRVSAPSLQDYEISVTLFPNQEIPLTLYGKQRSDDLFRGIRRRSTLLNPNEGIKANFHLNRHLDMTLPGKYEIFVSRRLSKWARARTGAVVRSNSIQVSILQPTNAR